jgi:MraZ protein
MDQRFRGTFEQKIDDKGRVNVPQRFRDIIRAGDDNRVLITNSRLDGVTCLDAYLPEEWAKFEERVAERKDPDSPIARFYLNYYLPGVTECQIDGQGRILLPPRLRDHAQLEREAIFFGVVNMFRIFNRDAHRTVSGKGEQILIDNPGIVPGFGI